MLEGWASDLLAGYLGHFFEVKKEQLSISLWSGQLQSHSFCSGTFDSQIEALTHAQLVPTDAGDLGPNMQIFVTFLTDRLLQHGAQVWCWRI